MFQVAFLFFTDTSSVHIPQSPPFLSQNHLLTQRQKSCDNSDRINGQTCHRTRAKTKGLSLCHQEELFGKQALPFFFSQELHCSSCCVSHLKRGLSSALMEEGSNVNRWRRWHHHPAHVWPSTPSPGSFCSTLLSVAGWVHSLLHESFCTGVCFSRGEMALR